jgi:hypothetical protein
MQKTLYIHVFRIVFNYTRRIKMKKYSIEHKNNQIDIPENIKNKIIKDHLMNSYHWVFAMSGLIIGFLLGIIAK